MIYETIHKTSEQTKRFIKEFNETIKQQNTPSQLPERLAKLDRDQFTPLRENNTIYEIINTPSQLRERFVKMDRDYFSYNGYEALLEYFNDDDHELDVIDICCDFAEESIHDIIKDYDINGNVLELSLIHI